MESFISKNRLILAIIAGVVLGGTAGIPEAGLVTMVLVL